MSTKTYVYPSVLGGNEYPSFMEFSFFDRVNAKEDTPKEIVNLYMPEQFSQPNTISWDTSSATEIIKRASGDIAQKMAASIPGGQGTVSDIVKSLTSAAKEAVEYGAAASGHGQIWNPFLTNIFHGVDFRNFSLTFKFVPFNEAECDVIYDIIQVFRKYSLPEKSGKGAFLKYPGEVGVKYKFRGKDNKYLHKFKRCIIHTIDVDYTGSGMWAMMRNGMPAEIEMKVAFAETEFLVRGDIKLSKDDGSSY